MRGARSLGYGFVEMAGEADAQAAVRALHKKTFDQREINVEIARSRVTDAELAERAAKPRRRTRTRRPDGENGAPVAEGSAGQQQQQGGERRQQGGERRQGGGDRQQGGERPPRQPRADGQQGGERQQGGNGGGRPPRQPRADGQQGGRPERAPRAPDAERPLSETTLFIANLPFSTTNAELLEFFKPAKAVDAVVSCRPSGRSKGFGFVKFAKADLANAVASMDNKQLADRKVTVRVAMTEFDVEKARNDAIQTQIAAGGDGKDGVPPKRNAAQE